MIDVVKRDCGVHYAMKVTQKEIWGDMGRYGEIWGDMGRYGEIWGDMGRYGEIWERCGRTVSTVRAPGAAGGTHTYTRYACSLGVVSPTHP